MKGAVSAFQVTTDKLNTRLGAAQTALDNAFGSPVYQMFDKFKSASLGAINAYGEIATAQGQIKSLGIQDTGIEEITKKAKEFSNTWSGTTTADFISASYDIKSAISTLSDGAVGEFTKLAALTGKATKSSTATMTSLFATGYGIHRQAFNQFGESTVKGWKSLSDEEKNIEFGKYFSAGIAKSVQAFKTDGNQLSAAISALGATATSANVSFAEQALVLGALQQTMSGSEAATKYKSFLGVAYSGGKKLGLNLVDNNNKLLSMPEILTKLKSKYGDTIDAIESDELKKAFGTDEAVGMIKLLYPEMDKLKGGIDEVNSALKDGTTLTEIMAKAMNEGPAESAKILEQRQQNLSASIGKTMAPLNMFKASLVGGVAVALDELITKYPQVSGVIGSFGYGISEAATMAIPMISQLPFLVQGFGMLKAGVLTALPAIWSFTAALLANPITWIVVGIVALIAAIYLLYKNFDTVSAYITGFWNKWKGWISPVLMILAPFIAIPLLIWDNWDYLKSMISEFFSWFSGIIQSIGSMMPDWMIGMFSGGGVNASNTTNNNSIGGENSPLAPNAPAVPVGADAGIQTINSNANSTVTLKIENAPKGSALGGDPMPGGSSIDMGYGMQ